MEDEICKNCGKPRDHGCTCEEPDPVTEIRNLPSDEGSEPDIKPISSLFEPRDDTMIFGDLPSRPKAPADPPSEEMTNVTFNEVVTSPSQTEEDAEVTEPVTPPTQAKKSIASTRAAPTAPVPKPPPRKPPARTSQKLYAAALAILVLAAIAEIALIALTLFQNTEWMSQP